MIIAIHHNPGGFSDRWIEYCKKNSIQFKVVNAYDSNIVEQLKECDAFMWHHSHADPKDVLFAKQLLFSLEESGKRVFPNWHSCWHFDDKVGQKYLLESIGAPLVPSFVFYTKKDALDWISKTTFPKVFKLRGGAGSSNVKLARTQKQARRFVRLAFGRGFPQFDRVGYLKERFRLWREGKDSLLGVMKGLGRLFIVTDFAKMHGREKGYAYFQDFIANNDYDIRVCVVGTRAFALKRMARRGDFRASGSGNIIYQKSQINEQCVRIAFDINKRLKAQSVAYDFVFDENKRPLIVEISYAYAVKAYDMCEGYWTEDMKWHAGTNFDFCGWMIDEVMK